MNTNIKSIFLVATILILLVGVTTISASDVSDDTTVIQDTATTVAEQTTTTDNIVETNTTKNIKTEEQTTDLYVSDTDGSDDNNGTNTSPYKTIQKALDTTSTDSTYNIYIAEGTYKGLGNTNLTVNGNYNINFIGDGINKTIIDGEAKYIIGEDTSFHWGSSDTWAKWKNCSGNWFLEISKGTGKITINNFTIKNGMNLGPSNIGDWYTSTVNNYGNLDINNVYFKDNHGGVGAATRNRENATIHIDNSIFEGGSKSESTGNYGAALYNNGTAIIENSLIINNYARWGSVTNDKELSAINCTFKNNKGYDGGSTYDFGAGIAIGTQNADYFNPYNLTGLKTRIINCTFENNDYSDIYADNTDLLIENCIFNKSLGVILAYNQNNVTTNIIKNNHFIDMGEGIETLTFHTNLKPFYAIYDQGCKNLTIENNEIIINNPEGYALILWTNATVKNNNITGSLNINNNQNTIVYNNISSYYQYGVILNGSVKSNNITNNNISSRILTGNNAVKSAIGNTVTNNYPENTEDITITNENYDNYFDNNGVNKNINNGTKLYLETTNKNYTFENIKVYLSTDSQVINSTITVNPSAKIFADNLFINNTNIDNTIILNSNKNVIEQTSIYSYNNKSNKIITINKEDNLINYTNINSINEGKYNVTTLVLNSSNNKVYSCEFNLTGTDNQLQLILMENSSNNQFYNNIATLISNSNITLLNGYNSNNNTIHYQRVKIDSNDSARTIVFNNSTENMIKLDYTNVNSTNNIEIIKLDNEIKSYNNSISGSYLTNSTNCTILFVKNGINTQINSFYANINAYNSNTITLSNCTNTSLNSNININVSDKKSYGLFLNNTNNTYIKGNYELNNGNAIILYESDNNQIYTDKIAIEYELYTASKISSEDTGIIFLNSDNNRIYGINITTRSEYTIILNNSANNSVYDNSLQSLNRSDDNSVLIVPALHNTVENNSALAIITMDNYNYYFNPDGVLKDLSIKTIELGSDFYGKNFTFNKKLKIYNPYKYIIYNGTISITNSTVELYDFRINVTDNRTTILNIDSNATILGASIYQYNNNPIKSIVINKNSNTRIIASNITVFGPEIKTNEDIPSTIAIYDYGNTSIDYGQGYGSLYINNGYIPNYIEVESISHDGNGSITALYKNSGKLIIDSDRMKNNINVKAKNVGIGLYINNSNMNQIMNTFINTSSNKDSNGLILNNTNNTQISYNDIYTDSNHTILIINCTNTEIIRNYLNASDNFYSDISIENLDNINTTLKNNRPILVSINKDNYNDYFTNDIFNLNDEIVTVILSSDIHNKNMIFNNCIYFFNKNNYTIYNGTVTFNKSNVNQPSQIHNLNLNSTDLRETLINNNWLIDFDNLNIYHESNTTVKTIVSHGSMSIINSEIVVKGLEIETEDNLPSIIGIYLNNSTRDINNTNITIQYTTYDNKGTTCGIWEVSESVKINRLYYNNINVTGHNNALVYKGISNSIRYNNITVQSNNNTTALLFHSQTTGTQSTYYNSITVLSNNTSYVFLQENTTKGAVLSIDNNITIQSNNSAICMKLNTTAMLLQLTNCTININAPIITLVKNYNCGLTSNGNIINLIGLNIKGYDFNVTNRVVTINNNKMIITSNETAKAVYATKATMKTNKITNNTIIIKGNYTESIYAINLTDSQATIQDNYIETEYNLGDDAIVANNGIIIKNNTPKDGKLKANLEVTYDTIYSNINNNIAITVKDILNESILTGHITYSFDNLTNTIDIVNNTTTIHIKPKIIGTILLNIQYSSEKYALEKKIELEIIKPKYSLTIIPINTALKQTINITAQILANNQSTEINKGKITFKVNGKTLKDANGKVIYAKVVNGTATIENYVVSDDWAKNSTTIQAIYSGSTDCDKLTSEKTNINITKEVPTLTTEDITATVNGTIALTATITDNDKIINTGKIVFKINGKTVKNVNGKVIYAKVVNNTVSVEYTLPADMKAKDYNITATFISSDYDRLEDIKTLTLSY